MLDCSTLPIQAPSRDQGWDSERLSTPEKKSPLRLLAGGLESQEVWEAFLMRSSGVCLQQAGSPTSVVRTGGLDDLLKQAHGPVVGRQPLLLVILLVHQDPISPVTRVPEVGSVALLDAQPPVPNMTASLTS